MARSCPNPNSAPGPPRGGGAPRGGYGGGGGFRGGLVSNNRAATCYKCGGPNHYARDCQAQAMKCYACGKLVSCISCDFGRLVANEFRAISPEIALRPMAAPSTLLARSAINAVKQVTSLGIVRLPRQTASQLRKRPHPWLLLLQKMQRTRHHPFPLWQQLLQQLSSSIIPMRNQRTLIFIHSPSLI